jgi:ATP-dependent RNA helicase HelY
VLCEALRLGLLDGLYAAELAAVASVFVHETRSKEPPLAVYPTATVERVVDQVLDVWSDVTKREEAAALTPTREPDAGFADTVWHWAHGHDLDDALGETDMTAGDFVRAAKQVADLLRQLRDVTSGDLAATAHRAQKAIVRGVVAYTGL